MEIIVAWNCRRIYDESVPQTFCRMNAPLETLVFFTRIFTGLILLLNLAVVYCVRLNIKNVNAMKTLGGEGKIIGYKVMTVMVIGVIFINGMAVYGNGKMLKAIADLTTQLGSGR